MTTKLFETRRKLVDTIEVRNFSAEGLEVRSGANGADTIEITGAPIVYNSPYEVFDRFGSFWETMAPRVAAGVIAAGVDCRMLINHADLPLARTSSGTLKLIDGPDSLRFVASLSARQQRAVDLADSIERGDTSQMSVGMVVGADDWADAEHRTVTTLSDLVDISAVTFPASPTTSIELARQDQAVAALTEIRQSRGRTRPAGRTHDQLKRDRIRWTLEDIKLQDKRRQIRKGST